MGLGWSLAAINFAIVVLVVTGISIFAVGMLRDLADEQGKARVQLAGAIAREDLRRMGEDALSAARILGGTPGARQASVGKPLRSRPPLLRRFCEADTIDACAVFEGDTLLAQAGESIPWTDIITANSEQGERFLAVSELQKFAMLGAVTPVPNRTNTRVFIVRLLDADLASQISKHVGLEVRLLNYRTYTSAPVDDFTPLHSAGLADGRSAVMRISPRDLYASSFPVFASTGEAIVADRNATAGRGHRQLGEPADATTRRHGHRAVAAGRAGGRDSWDSWLLLRLKR